MEKEVIFRRGNKVILRPIIEEDVPKFFIWMNDLDVTRFLYRSMPISLDMEKEWFGRTLKEPDKITLAIVDKENGNLIGSIGMHDIDYKSGRAITGTIIGDEENRGKGYGTEAKMMLLHFAFHELNLRKIYSETMNFNERSVNYSLKCGYVKEAVLPNHFYANGSYHDKIILAVYRETWEKLWKNYSKTFNLIL